MNYWLKTTHQPVSYFPAEHARVFFLVSLYLRLNLRSGQFGFAASKDSRPDWSCLLVPSQVNVNMVVCQNKGRVNVSLFILFS